VGDHGNTGQDYNRKELTKCVVFYFTLLNIEVSQFRIQPYELRSPVLHWLVDEFKIVTDFVMA